MERGWGGLNELAKFLFFQNAEKDFFCTFASGNKDTI